MPQCWGRGGRRGVSSIPAVSPSCESWVGQPGREGQRGNSPNKGMEGEPSQFGNGWPSGETGAQGQGVSVVRKRGKLGQTLCWLGAFSNVGSQQGHDIVRPLI